MRWVQDTKDEKRVVMWYEDVLESHSIEESYDEARQWCRKNKLMIWRDTLITIRFTSKQNLSWFLLSFS